MIAGVELRKQRALGDLVSNSFTILFAHWRQLASIAVPAVVVGLAYSLVTLLVEDSIALTALVGILSLPLSFLMFVLVGGGTVTYLDQVDRGQPATPADALDAAQARLPVLAGAALRSTAIVLVLAITVIGIPFAVYRAVRWAFLSQSIMIDSQRGEAVLAHSAGLVQGVWWVTLGRLIVSGIVVGVPALVLSQLILLAFPGVIGTVIAAAPGFITIPYAIIFTTLIFFDRKGRKGDDDLAGPAR